MVYARHILPLQRILNLEMDCSKQILTGAKHKDDT